MHDEASNNRAVSQKPLAVSIGLSGLRAAFGWYLKGLNGGRYENAALCTKRPSLGRATNLRRGQLGLRADSSVRYQGTEVPAEVASRRQNT